MSDGLLIAMVLKKPVAVKKGPTIKPTKATLAVAKVKAGSKNVPVLPARKAVLKTKNERGNERTTICLHVSKSVQENWRYLIQCNKDKREHR